MPGRVGILLVMVALSFGSAAPVFAWKGGYGYREHGYRA
jgi:hypothetical protein